ncbi:MAG: glycoside hydrolase family 2 protein [Lachnospiraceae bacterium]|nr:glycoside hydrolase family 2 protein [Lachnospiraceae bacterium]
MRKEMDFNEGWCFCLGDGTGVEKPDYIDAGWKKLMLPHDWSTEYEPAQDAPTGGGGGYATAGIGWYRKRFSLADLCEEEKVFLYFEGVYMDACVYLNGEKAGWHGYGFGSFTIDLTGKVRQGENVLAVRVDNSRQPNCRWYSGSGITRNVRLVRTGRVHVDIWGVRCDTNGIYPEQDQASLQIRTLVKNEGDEPACVGVLHTLYDKEKKQVCTAGTSLYVNPGENSDCMVRPVVNKPRLWTDEDPYLYTLVTTVMLDDVPIDEGSCRVGVRTAVFDCDKGFLLNGRTVKIKGMCLHHDCGMTGAVGYEELWKRRLQALKDMGCNGIRCAHNPPDPAFLELCDEMGFLVMDEIFDEWMLVKHKNNNYYSQGFAYGSGQFFNRYAKEELTSMLRRDYNHPSVILWSIGNEIPEQSSLDGIKILNFLQDICHKEDSSRMVTSACDNIAAIESNRTLREFENALDVVGYNYVGRWRERAETFYEEDRAAYPKRRMIGSENPSVGGRRGDYSGGGIWGSYVNATVNHEALWRYTVSHDFVAGDYLWTGVDYLGETRWPSRGAFFGPLDTAGFPKDSYYYFRSIWNAKEITLHLLPHWNWPGEEGVFKQVVCYTNCEKVNLYINGRLVGTRGYECPRYGAKKAWNDNWGKLITTNDLHLVWDVPYEPGELRAEGYQNGEVVAVAVVKTAKAPAALAAESDREVLKRRQLAQIELSAEDEDGNPVPDSSAEVLCEIEGPAHLVGMDSGDLLDLSLYSSPRRKMLAGRLLAVICADAPGSVTVTFTAAGMQEKKVFLKIE